MQVIERKYNVTIIFVDCFIPMDSFINIQDYTYDLQADRIALYPLAERDQSKLLVYHGDTITHSQFDQVSEFLPENSLLYFNDTKVISARLIFQKETGAEIEIFLLNPVHPSPLVQEAMQATEKVQWHCAIGNLKRWKHGISLEIKKDRLSLKANLLQSEAGLVELSWTPSHLSFADVIGSLGVTPLPPYLKRKAEPSDLDRYQTVYSHAKGAVAAPTAGLHFTSALLDRLRNKGMLTDFVTLHVSAGTFQPVKVQNAIAHDMHSEQVMISDKNIANLLLSNKLLIAVGTTSLRTLESLYWYGVKLLTDPNAEFNIQKLDPYQPHPVLISKEESFHAVAEMMSRKKIKSLAGETSIFILPGYTFRVCDGLITNFHQPGSTLLLLIAALIGEDWRKVYEEAMAGGYRFLSYGDSSLLFAKRN